MLADFISTLMIDQFRDFEFKNQQSDDNRKDPSPNASIRVRRNSPCAKRFNKRISSDLQYWKMNCGAMDNDE